MIKNIKEFTKEQVKIIYIGLVTLVFLLLFVFLVYLPQGKRLSAIKSELNNIDAQIKEISLISSGKDMVSAVKDMGIGLSSLKSKLPPEDQDVIRVLSEEAKKLKIDVKGIQPEKKIPAKSDAPGFIVEELPITMSLSCEFRMLGEYFNALRNNAPILVRVKRINIKGRGEGYANLDITLQMVAYLSQEKK